MDQLVIVAVVFLLCAVVYFFRERLRENKIVLWIATVFFSLFALYMLFLPFAMVFWFFQDLRSYKQVNSWPESEAIVVEHEWIDRYVVYLSRSTSSGHLHAAYVHYEYVVDGEAYADFFGPSSKERHRRPMDEEKKFLEQHPIGSTLLIRVDPKDPENNSAEGPAKYDEFGETIFLLILMVPFSIIAVVFSMFVVGEILERIFLSDNEEQAADSVAKP